MQNNLSIYEANITSQFGEDGIVEEILKRIGPGNTYCVEFGAWDGKHFSNTWHLWHDNKWKAVLIEGDPSKAEQLKDALREFPNATPYCAYVGSSGQNTLDAILARVGAPQVIDVLSIDIDGDDYHVFEAFNSFSSRVVLIEFNPTIPSHIELVPPPGNYFGSSALSIYKLAKKKGYSLAACTTANLIFVRNSEYSKLGFDEPTLETIMPTGDLTYVITSFNGTSYLTRTPTFKELRKKSLWRQLKIYIRSTLLNKHNESINDLQSQLETIVPVTIYAETSFLKNNSL